MARTHRLSMTAALVVCLVGSEWSGTLFARDQEPSSSPAPSAQSVVGSPSEAQGRTSASPAAAVSPGEQPAGVTQVPPSTVERLRFTLNDGMFTPKAPLGAASTQGWHGALTFVPLESRLLAQRGGYRGRGRGGRHAAAAAIILGAAASIAGGAILVYAYRPECRTNELAGGCGYGTKVVGGAVLSAGIVGVVVGALMWR